LQRRPGATQESNRHEDFGNVRPCRHRRPPPARSDRVLHPHILRCLSERTRHRAARHSRNRKSRQQPIACVQYAASMAFADDANALIQEKKFDDLESLWMNQLESDPSDVDAFLRTAKALRKAEQRTQSDTLLGLLAEMLLERKMWPQRLQVLKEIGRLSKHPAQQRPQIEEALRNTFRTRKSFQRAFDFAGFSESASNPIERAERIETWLQYDEGETFFMTGRGAGVVVELNPELGIARLDFERDKRVSVPLGAAGKFLVPIADGHVLREKFTDPAKIRAEAAKSPSAFFARILQSFGRPMTMAEVRDAVIGIVPEEKWSSWWTSARKNPQIIVSGAGAKAAYSW